MNLFDLSVKRNIVDEKTVLDKIEKAKTITSMPKAVKSGQPGLLELIQKVSANMDQYLGDKKNNYELITDQYRLAEYFDHIIENGIYSVDTETTGLDPMVDKVVGYSIYTPGEKAAYIPVNHISYITKQPLENQIPIDIVKREFDRATAADVKVVMANAKFDIRMLRQSFGVYLHVYFDCILAARLLNENEPSNKLKDLYKKYILKGQEDAFTFAELFSGVTFDLVPPNIGYLYAARDAEVTFELYEFQLPYLTPDHPLCVKQELVDVSYVFWNIEMPTIEVLADIEDTGVALDLNVAEQLTNKYIPIIQSYEEAFNRKVKEFGIEKHFDVSSPQQLAELFYDILGLVSPDKDKPRGTGKDILKELHHPIVDAVKDYRSVSTLVNTFVKKLPTTRNPRTGKVHCNYNQTGADTGRLACNDPNMQQIPNRGQSKEIRKMFMASPGYVLIGSDFSQQEPKLTAVLSNDQKMLESARNGGDVYSSVAAVAFNTTYENCLEFFPEGTPIRHNGKHEWEICDKSVCEKLADGKTDTNYAGKNRRTQAKSIVLGITYGRGIASIAQQLGTTNEEAQKVYDTVIATFVGLQDLKDESDRMAKEKGYVTTIWGRKRRLPDMQLPPYSIKFSKNYSTATGIYEVPENLLRLYNDKLSKCKGKYDVKKVIAEAKLDNIDIKSNQTYIARATRQCVNSRVQGCLDGKTKIFVEGRGFCNLEDCVDQHVKLWDGHKYTNGDVVYSGKKQKCIITLGTGEQIICSPDHKFLTVNTRHNYLFKKCSELKPGHRFPCIDPVPVVQNKLPKFPWKPERVHPVNFKDYSFSDIEDDFSCGQILGRLASDGSFGVRKTRGGSGCSWLQAEHEFELNDKIMNILKPFNPKLKVGEVRKNRNQRMSHINVGSGQLAYEAEVLDIKHQIHPALYANTELLRGFISGFFDGDGTCNEGASLKFGSQYDFKPLVRDMQKVLAFFGIRSHCHFRPYDHTLAIRKADVKLFGERISFMNSKKQHNAEITETVKDEHVFGKCVTVKSIEITDEYIDMYDVLDTDDGYFAADGFVVHNSAADMTKLAMCKIAHDEELKRLGFRMLIQVHDEIIGECPIENAEAASKRFAYVMSHAADEKISIPFSSDVVIEKHWNGGDLGDGEFKI